MLETFQRFPDHPLSILVYLGAIEMNCSRASEIYDIYLPSASRIVSLKKRVTLQVSNYFMFCGCCCN